MILGPLFAALTVFGGVFLALVGNRLILAGVSGGDSHPAERMQNVGVVVTSVGVFLVGFVVLADFNSLIQVVPSIGTWVHQFIAGDAG